MMEELQGMYVGQSKTYHIFEDNQCVVKRVTPYTWELYNTSWIGNLEIYDSSYGYVDLDKLVLRIKSYTSK